MLNVFKALADGTRLRLVAVLSQGEFTVQELTSVLKMGQSRVSRHLKILSEAGIISVKRQGTWAYYRLQGSSEFFLQLLPLLPPSFAALDHFAEDLAQVSAILDRRRRRSLEFFDEHARQWDRFTRNLLPVPDYLEIVLGEIPQCDLLLEVGVGTGNVLSSLRAKASRIIGVDHSVAMLDQARDRIRREGLADIEFRLGEMSHLPIGDGEVDCLLLNMVLHHAGEPERIFSEVVRVLSPGGVLVIADLQRHEQDWVRDRLADQWLGFESEELSRWLQAAGLVWQRYIPVAGEAKQQAVFILSAVPQPVTMESAVSGG
jgi:ubiquinone/menaquinone biosynthesis C-methylase UbiE